MTANHDHATLFIAPPATAADTPPAPAVDGGAEAMRRLRHPFAVERPPVQPAPDRRRS
jgi:hypothetical protein